MFTNKFCKKELLVVLYMVHWSKIIAAVCAMKMEYCGKHNIKLINPKQRGGKVIQKCCVTLMHDFFMLLVIYLCDSYASNAK